MKQVLDFIKRLRLLTVYLYFDTGDSTTCIYKRSVAMPVSAIGVMAYERERASSYLPCGFRLRTAVTNLEDSEYKDIRSFVNFLSSYICECTSDFRFLFREIQHTAVHHIYM